MTPHPSPNRVARRSAALLAALLAVAGTPLVARALGTEAGGTPAEPPVTASAPVRDETVRNEVAVAATSAVTRTSVPRQYLDPEIVDPTVPPAPDPLSLLPPGPGPDGWAALRECESGGDYTITNPSGRYRGAYQFDRSTWNSVAERHATHLVGIDPAAASPADQDAMAYALYTERGARPWPHCGRHLS